MDLVAKTWLDRVAYKETWFNELTNAHYVVYLSKFDGSYITAEGQENNILYLAHRGIVENLQHGLGFSPSEGKWYGWSHRAIYGFSIGSTCSKGDCHFIPSNKQELEKDCLDFWDLDGEWRECEMPSVMCKSTLKELVHDTIDEHGTIGLLISYDTVFKGYTIKRHVARNRRTKKKYIRVYSKKVNRDFTSRFVTPYPQVWGHGEWVAETMEDAKQMAIDFCSGVS